MTEQKITRRHVLGGAAVAGVGVPLLAACGSGTTTAEDNSGAAGSGESTDGAAAGGASSGDGSGGGTTLGPASDVSVGGGKIYPDANVVVTQPTAGTYVGFSAICTHQGCQVSSVSDGTINCPCHGSSFSIKDGSVVNGPASRPLEKAPVKVVGTDLVEG